MGASGGPPGAGAPPLAAATTWLLVRISPSADRMTPEPSSFARPRSVSSLTTLGTTLAATCSTEPGGTLAAGMLGAGPADTPVGYAGASGLASSATPPPTPADTTAIATAPAVKAPARERFWGTRDGAHRLLRHGPVGVVRMAAAAAGWHTASRTAAVRRAGTDRNTPAQQADSDQRDGLGAAAAASTSGRSSSELLHVLLIRLRPDPGGPAAC